MNRKPQDIKFVIIHHGGDNVNVKDKNSLISIASIYNNVGYRKMKANGWMHLKAPSGTWKYIQYHRLVARNGDILKVRSIKYSHYHCTVSFECAKGRPCANRYGIAICLPGNYNNLSPTKAQLRALVKWIGDFEKKYKLNLIIRGHRDRSSLCKKYTSCPGSKLYAYLKGGKNSKLVRWINYYKKTGMMPEEIAEGTACEHKLHACMDKLAEEQKQVQALGTRIVELEKTCVKKNNKIGELQKRIKALEEKLEKFKDWKYVLATLIKLLLGK